MFVGSRTAFFLQLVGELAASLDLADHQTWQGNFCCPTYFGNAIRESRAKFSSN